MFKHPTTRPSASPSWAARWLTAVATLSFLGGCQGHALMQNPVPFPSQLEYNGPMERDGSNWPCKGETEYSWSGYINIWERGSQQTLRTMGGATHGGGSCQISVAMDLKPTRKTEWKVIHSIQGGCPIRNLLETNYGDSPTTLLPSGHNFTVPEWLPLGPHVMAWTWYGRWSVPEMFMNCAPVMIMAGETDKDVDEDALKRRFKSQPRIFEANNGNGCWTKNLGSCVSFTQPGESLEVNEECPIDVANMLEGTCGPGHSVADLGWLRETFGPGVWSSRVRAVLFAGFVFGALVSMAIVTRAAVRRVRTRSAQYVKLHSYGKDMS